MIGSSSPGCAHWLCLLAGGLRPSFRSGQVDVRWPQISDHESNKAAQHATEVLSAGLIPLE